MRDIRKYIGECIYCGSKDGLQDEHCIPQSFNGADVLEDASCPVCADITSLIEQRFTRDAALPFRTVQNMKSKRPKKRRPTEFPMEFGKDGVFKEVNVPIDDYIPVLPLPELGPPGYIASEIIHRKGLRNRQFRIEAYTLDHLREEGHENLLLQKYGADEARINYSLHVVDFLRMIAKIAFCHCVFRYGLKNFEHVYVRDAILRGGDDVWKWVGSDGYRFIFETEKNFDSTHIIACGRDNGTQVRCRIKLINKSSTPEYLVVVGKLTDRAAAIFDSLGHK